VYCFCINSDVHCNNISCFGLKELADQILTNRLGTGHLKLNPRQTAAELGLVEVVMHLNIVLSNSDANSLHRPFIQIMNDPDTMQVSWEFFAEV